MFVFSETFPNDTEVSPWFGVTGGIEGGESPILDRVGQFIAARDKRLNGFGSGPTSRVHAHVTRYVRY